MPPGRPRSCKQSGGPKTQRPDGTPRPPSKPRRAWRFHCRGQPRSAVTHECPCSIIRRINDLVEAGLSVQIALDLLRVRTSSDHVFLACMCGIPKATAERLDVDLQAQCQRLLGATAWSRCDLAVENLRALPPHPRLPTQHSAAHAFGLGHPWMQRRMPTPQQDDWADLR